MNVEREAFVQEVKRIYENHQGNGSISQSWCTSLLEEDTFDVSEASAFS